MQDRVESGRAYSFYRDQISGLSIATIYTQYSWDLVYCTYCYEMCFSCSLCLAKYPQGEKGHAGVLSEPVRIGRSVVRLVRDDITQLEVDAFVFYARPDLALGSGFGTAISQRGSDPDPEGAEGAFSPIETGQAVVTGGGT